MLTQPTLPSLPARRQLFVPFAGALLGSCTRAAVASRPNTATRYASENTGPCTNKAVRPPTRESSFYMSIQRSPLRIYNASRMVYTAVNARGNYVYVSVTVIISSQSTSVVRPHWSWRGPYQFDYSRTLPRTRPSPTPAAPTRCWAVTESPGGCSVWYQGRAVH